MYIHARASLHVSTAVARSCFSKVLLPYVCAHFSYDTCMREWFVSVSFICPPIIETACALFLGRHPINSRLDDVPSRIHQRATRDMSPISDQSISLTRALFWHEQGFISSTDKTEGCCKHASCRSLRSSAKNPRLKSRPKEENPQPALGCVPPMLPGSVWPFRSDS